MVNPSNVIVPGGKLFCFKKIVEIAVGPNGDDNTFLVHDDILKADSGFFRAALDKAWMEGQDRHIKLPIDKPSVIQLYVQFLYTGKIPTDETYEPSNSGCSLLCDLFVFAEKVQNITVKNAVIKGMLENLDHSYDETTGTCYFPGFTAVCIIFQNTPKGSLARKLLVDIYAYYGSDITLEADDEEEYPHEFLYQLARRLMDKDDLDYNGIVVRNYLEISEV